MIFLEGEFSLVLVEIKYTQSVGTRDLRAILDCRLGIIVNNDGGCGVMTRKWWGASRVLVS